MKLSDQSRLMALLIDGDNAQSSSIVSVLTETVKYGAIVVRRIYGDWTSSEMSKWKESLHEYAVQPIQQFRYTTGKNATDSALIIDAMDLLHSGTVNGFCIVSSDSDFTRLATRVREQGFFVMGIGRSHTPKSFVNACEVFVYIENLLSEDSPKAASKRPSDGSEWTETVRKAIEMTRPDDRDGWAPLTAVGVKVREVEHAFDPRSFGHKQLYPLIRSSPKRFETREDKSESGHSVIYVRLVD